MRFSPQLLDEIRARLPVSQVVGSRVKLKRQGREFIGLSPFKIEKTPSFTVNDQKGFYHCFATGEHGDIFRFLMTIEGLPFPDAVERLAEQAGVPLPKDAPEVEREVQVRARLQLVVEASAKFYEAALLSPAGKAARAYLEKRGLDEAARKRFRVGYAPDGRFALKDALAKAGFSTDEMVRSGMLIAGDDIPVPYDRFRHRLMIPITDAKDRPIAFGGRILDPEQKPKYLNSPETPLFHKGGQLFNFAKARAVAHDTNTLVVVEGYMDAIALDQTGIKHVVAPLGTAMGEEQMKLLWRLVPEPILCFDGDSAGRRAAYRALDVALPLLAPGFSLRVAFLPDGLDPDDLVRQEGRAAVDRFLIAAKPLADVLFERETTNGDWTTPERRAGLEARFQQLVAGIQNPLVKSQYNQVLKDKLWQFWRNSRAGSAQASGMTKPKKLDWKPFVPGQQRPPAPVVSTDTLNVNSLTRAAPNDLPLREAILVKAILTHPGLIDDWAEEIAALDLAAKAARTLRDAVLSLHADQAPLDREGVATHLERLGLLPQVERIDRLVGNLGDPLVKPLSDTAVVEAGWRHMLQLQQRAELEDALKEAEGAFQTDGSEEAFERIRDLQKQLQHASHRPD